MTARPLVLLAATAAAGLALAPAAAAQATATHPASHPASQPASAPATQPVDPAVDTLLDRLEAKGDQIDSIEAAIEFIKIDPVLEDRQEYQGILRFKQLKPNPHFFIRFDRFKQEGITRQHRQWHVFDGQWYVEARENTKTIVKNEIVRAGETLEVFKLGHGPFPLPFGQKKADILRHFTVRLARPEPGDLPGCDRLVCTPRPASDLADQYDTVYFLIDRGLDLPVRVQTIDKQEGNQIIASFSDVKLNTGLAASQLNLPELKDYQIDTHPLRDAEPPDREPARP